MSAPPDLPVALESLTQSRLRLKATLCGKSSAEWRPRFSLRYHRPFFLLLPSIRRVLQKPDLVHATISNMWVRLDSEATVGNARDKWVKNGEIRLAVSRHVLSASVLPSTCCRPWISQTPVIEVRPERGPDSLCLCGDVLVLDDSSPLGVSKSQRFST